MWPNCNKWKVKQRTPKSYRTYFASFVHMFSTEFAHGFTALSHDVTINDITDNYGKKQKALF